MILVCDQQTPVGRRVRVVESPNIRSAWRGEEGKTTSIVGEVYPFSYEVLLDSGMQLVFFGNELEDLGWEGATPCPRCGGRGVVESGGAHVPCRGCA